ncbi:MAG: molybdopterin oxidoreductase family protein [Chloroflexota bacterium]|nr:molybdopterin oxidoreductase family protein [Chloroflexota bacterium]
MTELQVLRSVCPHDCPDACGLLAHVRGGRIVRVSGDPDHPVTRGAICGKAARYVERMYSPDRVLYPGRRIGPKGRGQFERISWDEALESIAERLHAAIRQHGAEAILPYSFAGTMGVVNYSSMDRRFFHRLGASQLARTVCSAAGNAGYELTVGANRGTDPEATVHARYIVAWGANVVSANMHQMTFVREAQRNGATFVHIDVHRNRTSAFADRFVQARPGTDAALALGMMHIIVRDGLHDEAYVRAHTVGFDDLVRRLEEYPPARVERITGVPVEEIERLAREYATTRPAFIKIGNGLQHHDNGGMAVRTIACLPALVGAWRDVGGGAVKSNAGYAAMNEQALNRPDLLGGRRVRSINMNQLGHALTELDDPPVAALVVYNSNPAVIAPDQTRVLAGLERADLFTVVHEQLMTDTARYADILLPATTHFEHTDLYPSYWHLYLNMARPVVERLGEAKPNIEVFALLAKAMGFDDPCFDDSADDIIAQAIDNPANPFLRDISVERLEAGGPVRLAVEHPHPAYADGRFPTPSGKIELLSERMAALGQDALPSHTPLVEGGDGEHRPDGPYRLVFITPPNHFFLNSTYANMPSNIRAEGEPRIEIHPDDARERGIRDGDPVRVYNDRGEVLLEARLSDNVRPGVVVSQGLWWGRHSPGGRGVNATTPQRIADLGGGATFFSNLVEVAPSVGATGPAGGAT